MRIIALQQSQPPFPLDVCIAYLEMWYSGGGMFSHGSKQTDYSEVTAGFTMQEYKNLVKFAFWMQGVYPITGRYLYRSVNVDKTYVKQTVKLVSKNPLSSWTTSENIAKKFFESVGIMSLQDNEYGIVVKCQMPQSRIMFSTDNIIKFLFDYADIDDTKTPEGKSARKLYSYLTKGMWAEQDEYVCRTKDFPLPVQIIAGTVGGGYGSRLPIWYPGLEVFSDH